MAADGLPKDGVANFNLVKLDAARTIFPLDEYLRRIPVEVVVHAVKLLPPEMVLEEIEIALRSDPYAWDLRHDREVMLKRVEKAREAKQ